MTALLAWVLAALAFCALSAAFAMVRLAKLADNAKNLVSGCDVIEISLVGTERLSILKVVDHTKLEACELMRGIATTHAEKNPDS